MSQLVEVHEKGMVQMIEHTKRANNCAQEAQKSSQIIKHDKHVNDCAQELRIVGTNVHKICTNN